MMTEPTPLTREELQLRRWVQIAGVSFFLETFLYLLPALAWGTQRSWVQLPFVANSFVKSMFFAGLCALAASDIRRYSRALTLVVWGLVAWCLAALAMLIWGQTGDVHEVLFVDLSMTAILWIGIGLEGGLAVGFALLHRRAVRARHGLRYLGPGQFRTVEALAECLLPPGSASLSPERVATNVDRYLRSFEARRKWLMKLALAGISLYPLLFLHLPLTFMPADSRREFLERRFRGDVARRRIGSMRRWLVQAMIRLGQQVVYLGYYGDRATWEEVGYVPFSERAGHDARLRRASLGLKVDTGRDVRDGEIRSEVAVVGSGAAAGVIAHHLAKEGIEVAMVERGRYEDPSTFTEDEGEMLARLYRDGAVQLARDFRLQVLQGMCVGGTTVINNAVSIDPPAEVLEDWNERLDGAVEGLADDAGAVRELLEIQKQPERVFSQGVNRFLDGVDKLELPAKVKRFEAIEANIRDCLGCGYCNIGCAYGRKLSVLDRLLPEAQATGNLRIVAETEAEGIRTSNGRVEGIACRAGGRRIRVRADRYVVCAGAVASSHLLGRSGVGGPAVGKGLGFNVGSPITAEFEERLDTYAGLQITHLLQPRSGPDYVMETWFNPVLSQALAMPGWFEDHRRNMLRYAHMAATGVIVGTETNGRVEQAFFGGADVVYEPKRGDLERLLAGLKLAGEIYLEAGAKRVMPATFEYHSFSRKSDLARLDQIVTDSSDIQLGTGHPQGGNALSLDASTGVVDPRSFRVHGTDNLYLCDASVFPTTIGVNPQLTVMALAHRAAPLIAQAA